MVKHRTASSRATVPAAKPWNEQLAGWLLVLTVLLLPLKLGGLTGVPETSPIYTADAFVLMIITWPPLFFPLFAGILLLGHLPLAGKPDWRSPGLIYVGLWLLLSVISLLGMVHASTWDFVWGMLVNLAGFAALAMTGWLLLAKSPSWRGPLLGAVTVGTILTAALGIQQYFSGFNDTIEYMRHSAAAYSADPGMLFSLIDSRRIFSTFSLPNSLAGYLILTAPIALYYLWVQAGQVEPPAITRALVLTLVGILVLAVLIGTGSRSAILMLAGAVIVLIWLLPFPRPIRWTAAGVVLAGMLAVVAFMILWNHRGTSSLEVRLDYYYCAVKMMLLQPFCGTGWGDFFHDYMRMKITFHREAPHTAHNFILDFASQAGVPGMLAAAAVLVYPLVIGLRRVKQAFRQEEGRRQLAILTGLLAWTLHSLTDVNLQVPASTGMAVLLGVMLLIPDQPPTETSARTGGRKMLLAVGAGLGLLTLIGSGIMIRNDSAFARLSTACDPIVENGQPPRLNPPGEINALLRETTEDMPWSPFPWATAGRYMSMIGDLNTAERYTREAIKRSPERAAFYYRLAIILNQEGRRDEALVCQRKAQELYPHFPDYQKPLTTSSQAPE